MKIALISCFDTYENRINDMEKYYLSRNHEVVIIRSNYLHFKKKIINQMSVNQNVVLLKVPRYKKNISIKRIISHNKFSNKCIDYLSKNNFDLIHVLIPPNMLCKKISKLSGKTKVIFDVIDFWPETMPIEKISRTYIYKKWQFLRNKYILESDYILTECSLFEKRLTETLKVNNIKTVYFTRDKINNALTYHNKNEINLAYLGSINNVIDIELIVRILSKLNEQVKVNFNIIGGGENKFKLIDKLEKSKIKYIDHGLIYDNEKKLEIFNGCSFAFNIMKKDVFVGLTMKSLDYFQLGIPIINNISYDSEILVDTYQVGINVNNYLNFDLLINDIIKLSNTKNNINLRNNTKTMFQSEFTFINLENKMDTVMEEIRWEI